MEDAHLWVSKSQVACVLYGWQWELRFYSLSRSIVHAAGGALRVEGSTLTNHGVTLGLPRELTVKQTHRWPDLFMSVSRLRELSLSQERMSGQGSRLARMQVELVCPMSGRVRSERPLVITSRKQLFMGCEHHLNSPRVI